ncbi:hypothetical protein PMAYCL1PPCAC_04098, partial [Pristionchus mayeri]
VDVRTMNEGYSDDEATLELQEDEQQWSSNTTSDRIRRSCASTDIAALMDTEMDEDSGREEMEEQEHTEALPQSLIEHYRDKFNNNAMLNRWTQPAVLDNKFRDMLKAAVEMCESGHADGTVEQFCSDNLFPLFRKWYCCGDAFEHWNFEIFHDMADVILAVLRMMRGFMVSGVGSRDIPIVLWDLVINAATDYKINLWVGERLAQMSGIDIDESAEADLVSPQHVGLKYARFVVLAFDADGFKGTQKFFYDNITTSTSIEELLRYFKAHRMLAVVVNQDIAFSTYGSIVYTGLDRLSHASEEELSCKNLRGPLGSHPLYCLYELLHHYVTVIYELHTTSDNIFQLYHWRLKFCLKALVEAPFNGRMGAVESLTYMVHETEKFRHMAPDLAAVLAKWLEEERAVDQLTRDNLHNMSYVDRVLRAFEQMLKAGIFTTGDLSTVWEAQRGKHDVIQRNLADLIVRIVPHFDNDLLDALFHKIEAGWVDGGATERSMLIDIVRRIGEASAYNVLNSRRIAENDHALITKTLQTLWQFIRRPRDSRENEEGAMQAHLKLLEESRSLPNFLRCYAELCSDDIQKANHMSATAASHLVHILELVSDDEEEEDDDYVSSNAGRHDLIGVLESQHDLVNSLCTNIAKIVRTEEDPDRRPSLHNFLHALSFVLNENRDYLKFTEEHASELWVSLISRPTYGYDTRFGFKFFLAVVDAEVMEKQMLEKFFKQYVLALPPAKVSLNGYHCFEAFFKAVNYDSGKDNDCLRNPESLVGSQFVQQLMLQGQSEVYERASNLWVEYLQKIIDSVGDPTMTTRVVGSLVKLIKSQYDEMTACVREAGARGLATTNPAAEMTKERTMRCIKVLSLLVNGMDEEVGVARRSEPALGKAAIGRPILISCKVPRREWESLPYHTRGNTRVDDLDNCADLHENSSVGELRDCLKRGLLERLGRRRADADEIFAHFLLVHCTHDGPKALHFTDYKRTLGEMGMGDVVEVEVRLQRSGGSPSSRQGEASPDSSTSESDWLSPEDAVDDEQREAILPSKAIAADEGLVELLLKVAESEDVDIAMAAFQILKMVPQNEAKLAQLHEAVRDEARLRSLLVDASDARFLYNLMMLEAIILPADTNLRNELHPAAINAMMMFVRVLPEVGKLSTLMQRSIAFRSLAILPITRMLHLACMTAARVITNLNFQPVPQMHSLISSLVRLQSIESPPKWSKYMRVRRLSSVYTDLLAADERSVRELKQLIETHAPLLLRVLCGVVLSAAATHHSAAPLADEGARVLTGLADAPLPVLDEAVMDADPCTLSALLEYAMYATSLLAIACPIQCAVFMGALAPEPDPVWVHTLLASCFSKAENVRMMAWSIAIGTLEVVRQTLHFTQPAGWNEGHVSLTSTALDLLPRCKGAGVPADQFVALVKELVHRSSPKSWDVRIVRLDEHIAQAVEFLEQALQHSTTEQTSFPDDTYLRARIEVLQMLIRHTTVDKREWLGSAEGGPRLCERLLADFIFPAARAADAAAAAAAAADVSTCESDMLPRSLTHVEMNSSSSLFDLKADCSLPRSVSALPISTRRVAVCSGEGSQDGAFHLLLALCEEVPANQILMQNTIHRLFYSNPWTDKKDFEYLPQHVLRQDGDLVGLKNGGATCYMNSIFQQLFMIDEVREAVLNANIPEKVLLERRTSDSSSHGSSGGAEPPTPNRGEYAVKVLAAVQTLFAHLLGSELDSYRPAEFWKVFNFKPNGESVNVREQQDAVEFHNMVTELIDEGLKKCGAEAMCERTFRGVFADEKICKDCPHRYTKEEAFELLSLDVRSHNNLRDSLKEYVRGDVLENDNAYQCEACNKKVKAIKRLSLSKLPDVLIVQLKRFDFDWEKEIAVKFNDYFEFPFEMDIQPYTLDGLEKLEKGLQLEDNRDYQYMLRGVVVHSGQAQGGHYTSYIRNRENGKWYKFDDNDVTPWDASESGAQQRWFGCSDNGQDSMGRGRRKIRTTYWNAYMLFYEKLETANRYLSVNPSSVASDMSTSSGVSSMTTTMTTIMTSAISPTAVAAASSSPSCVSPAPGAAAASTMTTSGGAAAAPSPVMRDAAGEQMKLSRSGKSASPVSNLHRHFSSMSLSSARIRMPPRLEEMLREGNRRVQLERVQYSMHFFSFISAATSKALATAELHPECAQELMLATMKSFASFIVHNGLFASRDLMSDDPMQRISFKTWLSNLQRLLEHAPARLWLITHVLFSHEMAACFLFASDANVREFFRVLILDTMVIVDEAGDLSEACLKPNVLSPVAGQLSQSIRQFPRLSYLLANLLGMLPYKHNAAFRSEPLDFYRAIIELSDRPQMMVAMVRGGILNNLLAMFSPMHIQTELTSLQRKDTHVYEALHGVIASGLRTIRLEKQDVGPNPFCNPTLIIRRTEIPDFKVIVEFMQPNGGHVKYIGHLIEILRRSSRSSGSLNWAVEAVAWLCHGQAIGPSVIVMDAVCQIMGSFMNDTATEWLVRLLGEIFGLEDQWYEARFEHLFHKAQLTASHAQASVQGLVEYTSVSESRYEALCRVLLVALQRFPFVPQLIDNDEQVQRLLDRVNTIAMCKPGNKFFQGYLSWYESHAALVSANNSRSSEGDTTAETAPDSAADTTMDEEPVMNERGGAGGASTAAAPAAYPHDYVLSQLYSPGQLSPSSRMGMMTISTGEKRPLPPTEEGEDDADEDGSGASDRKRSIGETAMRRGGAGGADMLWQPRPPSAAPPPPAAAPKIEDYAASPMDDRDLLISSSLPSSSKATPSQPPPSYNEVTSSMMGGAGVGGAPKSTPPPIPPRPSTAPRLPDSPQSMGDNDEFVEKHKAE